MRRRCERAFPRRGGGAEKRLRPALGFRCLGASTYLPYILLYPKNDCASTPPNRSMNACVEKSIKTSSHKEMKKVRYQPGRSVRYKTLPISIPLGSTPANLTTRRSRPTAHKTFHFLPHQPARKLSPASSQQDPLIICGTVAAQGDVLR